MVVIVGLTKLRQRLEKMSRQAKEDSDARVIVGFTQAYAVYVHEDLSAAHKVGQAKFLEQPARELSNDGTLGNIVADAVSGGKRIEQGLVLAGLRLQREAQELVPVDTSALKASAFTCVERDLETTAAEALARSEALHQKKVAVREKRKVAKRARKEKTRAKRIKSSWSKQFKGKSR